ncbi:MAG: hypothetical protein DYG89_45530 [Caldilinea sp. CFX5]|nr:hypothetical protein [Caldilinea sp. CFX5]
MSYQVTRTKIVLPRRRSDLLSRPRLVNLLEDLLDFRLVILIAPAGYGKTFLLVDFAHHLQWPVCWYALDALDRDAYRFCSHFIAAIQQKFPAFGQASLAALQSMAIEQRPLDQLVTTIVNELYDHVQEHFVLVLDDFYLIDENPEINAFISQFIQQVDENCHLIIASRRLLSLPDMALMVARGYVGGLDFEDLAFAVDELQELSAKNFNQSISAADAKILIEATDGWIIGLLLSTQSKLRNISGRMRHMRASGINLYDYLAEQVLNQQPPVIQEFLLRTSLLEEFDADLCAAVLTEAWLPPTGDWQDLIDEVLRRNLFVLSLGDNAASLRYNYVFQEFLQRRIARERPTEERTILERLAALYQAREEWEKTHYMLTRLGEPRQVVALIEQTGVTLLEAGRFSLLGSWLKELPVETIRSYPMLLMVEGFVKARQGDVKAGLVLLDEALAAQWPADAEVARAYALTRRSVVHRWLGNYQASLHDVEAAFQHIAHFDQQAVAILSLSAIVQRTKGFTLSYYMGKTEEGAFWLERAVETYRLLNQTQNLALTYSDLAVAYLNTGRYRAAQHLFQDALAIWRNLNDIAEQASTLNNLGYLHHLLGKYEEALAFLDDTYECAKRSGYLRVHAYALASMGDLCMDLGLWEVAQALYQDAMVVAQRLSERFLLVTLELAQAKVAAQQKEWSKVFTALDAAGHLVVDVKASAEWGLYQLTFGYCHLLQGKAKEAIGALQNACDYFQTSDQPIEEANARLLLSFAHNQSKQIESAQEALQRALDLAFALESRYPLLFALRAIQSYLEDKRTVALDERLLSLNLELTKIEETIPQINRRLRQQAPPLLAGLLTKAPHLVIRALGRAEVVFNNKVLTNSDWQTLVSRDLLLCLLAHPRGLSKDEIGLLFWPDASPSELKTRFKNAIYRLRSAVKEDVVLFENDFYTFNRTIDYEYDVELFLRNVEKAQQAATAAERMSACQAALALYRGPYLPEVEASWTWSERERLSRLFAECALTLSQSQLDQADYNGALESVQRVLAEDSCQEDAHRLAMRIYAALGNRAAIARQYAQCEQALLTEIDASPSPQTADLYQALMR